MRYRLLFLLFAQSETSQIYPLEYAQSLVDNLKNIGKDARLFVVKGKFVILGVHIAEWAGP